MDASRFFTRTLRDPRMARILAAAIEAVEPGKLVRDSLEHIPKTEGRIFALGLGKAAVAMTRALANSLRVTKALVITKHATIKSSSSFTVMEGGHPVPDARSLTAGQAALDFVAPLQEDDLLVCLISGGGSALVTAPVEGVTLQDMQDLTSSLLACGATIDEINTVRRQLDRIKGGGLAEATKARILSLILSDVLGNPLETIASGPTVPNPTTSNDVLNILKKHKLTPPESLLRALGSSPAEFGFSISSRAQNFVIGDLTTAAQAAQMQAEKEGFNVQLLNLQLQGEASQVGREMANHLVPAMRSQARPFCLIAGGETTVTMRGRGKGGRNQELALASVEILSGVQDAVLVSLATDGEDGPTDAAGAVVNGQSHQRGEKLGMFAADYLSRNDAYAYFTGLGDLLKPGPTGTNVNDLIFLFGL